MTLLAWVGCHAFSLVCADSRGHTNQAVVPGAGLVTLPPPLKFVTNSLQKVFLPLDRKDVYLASGAFDDVGPCVLEALKFHGVDGDQCLFAGLGRKFEPDKVHLLPGGNYMENECVHAYRRDGMSVCTIVSASEWHKSIEMKRGGKEVSAHYFAGSGKSKVNELHQDNDVAARWDQALKGRDVEATLRELRWIFEQVCRMDEQVGGRINAWVQRSEDEHWTEA